MLTALQKLYKGLKKTIPYKNTIFSGWTLSSPKGNAFQSFSIGYLTTFDQKKKNLLNMENDSTSLHRLIKEKLQHGSQDFVITEELKALFSLLGC